MGSNIQRNYPVGWHAGQTGEWNCIFQWSRLEAVDLQLKGMDVNIRKGAAWERLPGTSSLFNYMDRGDN